MTDFKLQPVPYSSVVGSGFMVLDERGQCIATMNVMVQVGDYKETAEQITDWLMGLEAEREYTAGNLDMSDAAHREAARQTPPEGLGCGKRVAPIYNPEEFHRGEGEE